MPGATTSAGLLTLHDAETGELVVVDSGSSKCREAFENAGTREANQRTRTFRKLGIDEVARDTASSYVQPLVHFFQTRPRAGH